MILKRILTRKSIMGFGSSSTRDLSVQMLLDTGQHNLLTCAYFNLDKIGFTDDILDELGITQEYRIDKPGKSEEKRKKFFTTRLESMNETDKIIYFNKKKKDKAIGYIISNKKDVTRRGEYLRAKNHGNI
jgi:hypothetical protein